MGTAGPKFHAVTLSSNRLRVLISFTRSSRQPFLSFGWVRLWPPVALSTTKAVLWAEQLREIEMHRRNIVRSRIRTFGTFCTFEKDSLARASEKCGLIIGFSHHSENLRYFHDRAIAALRPGKAIFRVAVGTEKDN